MKKIVTIIVCLLGVLCAYAHPYRGYTQTPVVSMRSTSSMLSSPAGKGIVPSQTQVYGIRTYASNVTGGVTSGETFGHVGSIRRTTPTPPQPGDPGFCPYCQWELKDGEWYCPICKRFIYDECGCEHDHGHCDCPIESDWKILFFLSALAGVYKSYKQMKKKQS